MCLASIRLSFLLSFFFIFSLPASSQITSAGVRGIVTVTSAELPEKITVQAIHEPTGSVYNTTTQAGGSYTIPNMRSGGPYTVVFSAAGLQTDTVADIFLTLGAFTAVDVVLQSSSQTLTTVIITGARNVQRKTGVRTSIGKDQLERLPTLNRSLQDFIRLSPQANGNSLAGTNYRYNNLSIDGAALNDAFGFTEPASGAGGSQATGTPGSLAKTQPISLEAIQEVQVEVSPYTVTLGNFTGGSINAVTRSGTNTFSSSLFFSGRNKALTGRSADAQRSPVENFHDYQTGFRLGGAVIKNKLFYFAAVEMGRREQPVAFAPGGAGAAIPFDVARLLYDTVFNRYGYDLGTYNAALLKNNSNKIFARVDWNVDEVHKLSLRTNYVQAFSDNLERNANVLNFGSQAIVITAEPLARYSKLKVIFLQGCPITLSQGIQRLRTAGILTAHFFRI